MRLIWLSLLTYSSVHADVTMRVRPQVRAPAGRQVNLGQLCEVPAGLALAIATELSRTIVATSPARVETARLIQVLKPVLDHARAAGVNLRLNLPRAVEIAAGRELNPETLTQDLIAAWQPLCPDCRLSLEGMSAPLVPDVTDWTIKGRPDLPRGSFSVALEITRSRGGPLTAWVNGRLIQKRRVPVAARLIQAGERIAATDFKFDDRDVAQAQDGIPADAEITGHLARRGLNVGDVLWTGTLERERAVRRGDQVRVRAAEGAWDVSINVTSPQDAFVGDVVNFKNTRSGAVVVARVTAYGEAELR